MNISKENILGEVVASDFRTAAVFDQYNLDFCCKGSRSIEEACLQADIDPAEVLQALEQIQLSEKNNIDFNSWPLDLLADYIEKKHHRYVSDQIPVLQRYLDKINTVHGLKHSELAEIKKLFSESAGELTVHMKKEELLLFPFIRKMVQARQAGTTSPSAPFGSVQNPVLMMIHDHDVEGDRFRKIAQLSNNYTPPSDGCTTYQATLALLKEFEQDLHVHIHLENNILFPKAISLEQTFG